MENLLIKKDLEEMKEQFQVVDLQSATWVFRKLRAIEKKTNEIREMAEIELSRIKEWVDKELKQYDEDSQYFRFLLEEYYKREKEKDKKFKLTTPWGKVSSRTSDRYIYENEETLLNYCQSNQPQCVRIKRELDKNMFKRLCKNGVDQVTGEVIDGVRVEKVEVININVEG